MISRLELNGCKTAYKNLSWGNLKSCEFSGIHSCTKSFAALKQFKYWSLKIPVIWGW